jgi:hypothetical protein
VSAKLSREEIRTKCHSISILKKIQSLSTFALTFECHNGAYQSQDQLQQQRLVLSAHDLFGNHEFRRRQMVSEQEVSSLHEFISKMTLLHHYTAWELLQETPAARAAAAAAVTRLSCAGDVSSSTLRLFSAQRLPSVGARIFEMTSLKSGFEVRDRGQAWR